jgi:hypothetical protein
MPRIVRWFVKTAFVYLAAALVVGLLESASRAGLIAGLPPGIRPVSVHFLVVGWVSQLIFGIALWMFPKFSQDQPRGPEWAAWATYACLNAGLLLRAVAEPQAPGGGVWGGLLVASAVLQWAAGLLFIVPAWRRVRIR